MQILALLGNFGPQNVPLIQTSDKFLGWFHMVWCLIYQIKPLVLNLATLDFSPLSSGFENLWPSVHLYPQITCFQRHFSVVNPLKSIIEWAKWADSLGSFFQLIKWAELASSIWRAELSRAELAGSIWRVELSWAFSEIEFGELSWAEPKSSARLSASFELSYSSFHL